MRNLLIFVTTLLLITVSSSAAAVKVKSIYQAQIPVGSQSAADKAKAAQQGLIQVLIKVSGNGQIMEKNPVLKNSLSQAEKLAQEYRYSAPSSDDKGAPYILNIRYDAAGVNHILQDSGTPTWGMNRPLILVWLAFEGPNQSPDIVDSTTPNLQTLLRNTAKLRGLPVILPTMDVTDLGQVSANDILAKSVTKLQAASQRYNSDAILIGHLMQVNDDYTSQWRLIMGDDQWNWDFKGKSTQDILTQVMNNIADTLSGRYATVVTNSVQSELTLKVAGIKRQGDLMELMKYLQHLTPVAEVQLVSVTGSDIVLNISLRGSKDSFVQALALGKNLTLTSKETQNDEDALSYQWSTQ